MTKLDPLIAAELAACPLPWSLDVRKRHILIRIAGQAVTKLPTGHCKEFGRASLNVRAAIRRAIRENQS